MKQYTNKLPEVVQMKSQVSAVKCCLHKIINQNVTMQNDNEDEMVNSSECTVFSRHLAFNY